MTQSGLGQRELWHYPEEMRRIVCAANRYGDVIIPSPRHWDIPMRNMVDTLLREDIRMRIRGRMDKEEQGFIDQAGNFLTRQEAWVIAERNGQIRQQTGNYGTLFSEDLY